MKAKAAIVIPNLNGEAIISDCLSSLEVQSLSADIIVVDNGSTDNSVDIIKSKHPKVKILELEENTGFTGGVNHGIKRVMKEGYEYVALFNSDAVADKKWLSQLVSEMVGSADIGIATGKLMRSDKTHIDSTGDFYTIWGLPFARGRNHKDTGQYNRAEYVFGASGGASLYRVSMLEKIGLFDEDFFAYYEDVDISFRAQMAGWKVRYTPKAVAYHGIGVTSSKMGDFTRYHSAKNFLLLYTRNMPMLVLILYLPLLAMQWARLFLDAVINKKATVFIRGSAASLFLIGNTMAARRGNRINRKLTTAEINDKLIKSRAPKVPSLQL